MRDCLASCLLFSCLALLLSSHRDLSCKRGNPIHIAGVPALFLVAEDGTKEKGKSGESSSVLSVFGTPSTDWGCVRGQVHVFFCTPPAEVQFSAITLHFTSRNFILYKNAGIRLSSAWASQPRLGLVVRSRAAA